MALSSSPAREGLRRFLPQICQGAVRVLRGQVYFAGVSSVRVKSRAELLAPLSFGQAGGAFLEARTPQNRREDGLLGRYEITPANAEEHLILRYPCPR